MPLLDRQQIQVLLNAMRRPGPAATRADAARRLFAQLNYASARKPIRVEIPAEIKKQIAEPPTIIATGASDAGFLIIHTQLSTEALPRLTERAVVSALLKDHPYALFVFSNADHSRWNLLNVKVARKEQSDDNREHKLRRLFRRISVGPEDRLRTAIERIEKLDPSAAAPDLFGISALAIQVAHDDAFDVESVTREFFKEYKRIFEFVEDAITGIRGPDKRRLFTQRLFNRLMFIAFIQKKGWLKFPGMEDNDYLDMLWRDYRDRRKDQSIFYDDRLSHLFFNALNTPFEVNIAEKLGKRAKMVSAIGDVPYLNGGLFERSDDGTDEDDSIVVPDKAIRLVLEELFARFNFTVSESTPLDLEVAVDPEMLGKVFEELVTGRHESGSYYTPKPIVSFMCREALKGYLQSKCPTESIKAIADFVDEHNATGLDDGESILDALKKIKCCDPACGSGAYLLGMMHELLDLRASLFAVNKKLDAIKSYERKLEIIQTNVYGVDLDPFAVNIARLRLWLSLAVEFEGNAPPPLPNLDFKIEAGDSLAAPDPSGGFNPGFQASMVDDFLALKREFLMAHSQRKKHLKNEIQELRKKIMAWTGFRPDPGVFNWQVEFAEVFVDGGFDAILANPPYVRHSLIKPQKPMLKSNFPEVFTGAADLCVYFFGRAVQLLRPGGTLAFIASNKWMKANYGRSLRTFLVRHAVPRSIVDFGHSPIFPEADTFPCVPILQRRKKPLASGEVPPANETFAACMFPGGDYEPSTSVSEYVHQNKILVPTSLLRPDYWSLEDPRIQMLLSRIREIGTPLGEFCGGSLYIGPVTGFDEAFYIDQATRDELIEKDPKSSELIRPLLRGRDIQRWQSHQSESYIILSQPGINIGEYPAIKKHLTKYRSALEKRACPREWFELQGGVNDEFGRVMFQPKIVYQEIQFHSRFSLDTSGQCINHKVFMVPSSDLALLGVLCSPLMWWFLTRTLPHMKDEALCTAGSVMERIPMTTGSEKEKAALRINVQELIELADQMQQWQHDLTSGLIQLIGVPEPDSRIINWLPLSPDVFNSRLAKLAGVKRLPLEVAAKTTAVQMAGRSRQIELLRSQLDIELRVETLVEDAFGLTLEERQLLRSTKPVRDPIDVLRAKIDEHVAEPHGTRLSLDEQKQIQPPDAPPVQPRIPYVAYTLSLLHAAGNSLTREELALAVVLRANLALCEKILCDQISRPTGQNRSRQLVTNLDRRLDLMRQNGLLEFRRANICLTEGGKHKAAQLTAEIEPAQKAIKALRAFKTSGEASAFLNTVVNEQYDALLEV